MTHDENFYKTDRVLTIQDERERIVVLKDFNLELPTVGIFDEPTRCYTINKEWAKIVTGAVDILLEIAVWKNAQDEGYAGIRAILEFLKGGDCVDCDFIENCLATSPTILAILQDIQDNASNIQTNATNIQSNTNSIDALNVTVVNLSNQIASNDTDIANLDTRLDDVELSILGINAINIQQDNRLTALESKISSSGSTNFKASSKIAFNSADYTNTGTFYATAIETTIPHEFTYDNALIFAEFKGRTNGTGNTSFWRLAVAGQPDSVNVAILKESVPVSAQVSEIYSGLKGQTLHISLEFARGTGNPTILANQNVSYTIIEWEGIPNNIVTFDDGGLPYTLVSPNTGVVSSGGNPGMCLFDQAVGFGDALGIEVDFGSSKQVNSVTLDVFSSDFPNTYITIYVGGVQAQQATLVGAPNAWRTYQFNAGSFPLSGQTVRVYASAETGVTIAQLRYDNIQINYE